MKVFLSVSKLRVVLHFLCKSIYFILEKSQATSYASPEDDKAHLWDLTSLPPTFHSSPLLDKFCSFEIKDFGVLQLNKLKLSRGEACKGKGEGKCRLIIHQYKQCGETCINEVLMITSLLLSKLDVTFLIHLFSCSERWKNLDLALC